MNKTEFPEEFDHVHARCREIKNNNAPAPSPISCRFEKNAIHHTHIALHICYLSFDSGDGLGLLRGGGVEVLGAGDFRGRDGKDDLDVAGVALVRVAKSQYQSPH